MPKAHSPKLTPTNDPQSQHPIPRDESEHGSERVKTKSARVQSPGVSIASDPSHKSYHITIDHTLDTSDSTGVQISPSSRRTSSSWEDWSSTEKAPGKGFASERQGRLGAADKLEDSDSSKEFDRHRDSTRRHRPPNPYPPLPPRANTLTRTTTNDNDKKFARLEKLMTDFKEEQAAREAAEIRRKEDERVAEAAHAREKSLLERERAISDIEKAAKKTSGVKQVIKLKDAVGRNHRFPFANCRTWEVSYQAIQP